MNEFENNPEYWKFGLFYFNPNDKRLLVPKKVKAFGLTFNFAHPLAIPCIVLTLVFLAILSKMK